MPLRDKRHRLALALRSTGLLAAIERFARRPGLLVLCYHRIGDPSADPFYGPVFSATPSGFADHLAMLKSRLRLLTLDEATDLIASGRPLRDPCALITFDDGYRDNLTLALPALHAAAAPAAFFLPTGFLDRPRPFWWDTAAYVIKQSRQATLELDRPRIGPLPLATPADRDAAAIAAVLGFLPNADPPGAADRFLDHLADRTGVAPDPAALGRQLFLTWDEARTLADAQGIGVGSHTVDHPKLAKLAAADRRRELADSKARLESELRRPVAAIAYPFGGPDAVDEPTAVDAASAGYRAGFTFRPGRWRRGDPLRVGRINVGSADSTALLRARLALLAAAGRSPL